MSKKTVETKGEAQASPEEQKTVRVTTVVVASYTFRGIKKNQEFDVIADSEVDAYIAMGLIIPVGVKDVPLDEVNLDKLSLSYQTKCGGCGQ